MVNIHIGFRMKNRRNENKLSKSLRGDENFGLKTSRKWKFLLLENGHWSSKRPRPGD